VRPSSSAKPTPAKPPARRADVARESNASPWPTLAEILNASGPFFVPLILFVTTRLAFWALLPFASEDAYITFRYARHIATGLGPVYNPGERVMGFSSPLWTLWMGAGYALLRDPVVWSRVWELVADLVTLLLGGGLLQRYASRRAATCFTLFFAAWPYFSAVTISGMENGVFVALILLAATTIERGGRASGPWLAAVALIRPEGLVAAAVLALGARWRDRWIALAIVGAAIAGLWSYYGSPLPQSVLAKSQLYGTPGPWAGRGWWEWVLPFPFGRWPALSEATHLLPLAVLFSPALVWGAILLWRARDTALARAAAAMLAIWLGYSFLGVVYFYWYFIVPLVGLALVAAVGLPRVVAGRSVLVAAALYVLGTWTVIPILYIGRAQNEFNAFGRVSNFLHSAARPGQKVMLEPIGMIGFQNPLVVVDEVGLVSPEVSRRRLAGPGWYADVASSTRPDWLVVRRGVLRSGTAFAGAGAPFRSVEERDSLLARYHLVQVEEPQSGDAAIEIYQRAR